MYKWYKHSETCYACLHDVRIAISPGVSSSSVRQARALRGYNGSYEALPSESPRKAERKRQAQAGNQALISAYEADEAITTYRV
jgi:hypothetical protein